MVTEGGMKFWDALRESVENGAWIAWVWADRGYANDYAQRWDKASGLWQLAHKEGPGKPYRMVTRPSYEAVALDARRFTLEAEWEIVKVET
jgi:hypothetical protein